MTDIREVVVFAIYLIVVLGIGVHFFRKNLTAEEYILGGKRLGKWVTAISAQASDMSGWLFMGLPGAVYLFGLSGAWIAVGLLLGTCLNWRFIAPRLRAYTGLTESLTLPHFLERRFGDPTGALRLVSAMITLFFFTIYAAAGLNAAAKLFEITFGIEFQTALLVGGACIILYTLLGGYLAVCWTDLLQGGLMLITVVGMTLAAWFMAGGAEGVEAAAAKSHISLSLWPGTAFPVLAILSALAWGLGYCGMPHILARFMSVDSVRTLRPARRIALVWVAICLVFAVLAGVVGIPLVPGLEKPAHETVFILIAQKMFHPLLAGLFLTGILAAIMSTIDSQLLVSASVLTEDLNLAIAKREFSGKNRIFLGRVCVAVISVLSLIIAADRDSSILKLVEYSWGGLGAAFGPVVVMALYSRRTSWRSALLGMCLGSAAVIVWEKSALNLYMYEIVPGFLANLLAIHIGNRFWPQTDYRVLDEFDRQAAIVRAEA